jgi:DNA-binding LytR/AlgR family response regulator
VAVDEIRYFKADGYLIELHKTDGSVDLIEKALSKLEQILPERFLRVHRSYIVDTGAIESFRHLGGTQYEIGLKNGEILPLSRKRLGDLKGRFEQKVVPS